VRKVVPRSAVACSGSQQAFWINHNTAIWRRASQAEKAIGIPHAQQYRRYSAQQPVYAMLAIITKRKILVT
jgi:hypothetical protein